MGYAEVELKHGVYLCDRDWTPWATDFHDSIFNSDGIFEWEGFNSIDVCGCNNRRQEEGLRGDHTSGCNGKLGESHVCVVVNGTDGLVDSN